MNEIKRIPNKIELTKFIIYFEYKTKKGLRKEQQRFIYSTEEYVESDFKIWASGQKAMFKPKILSVANTNKTKIIEV